MTIWHVVISEILFISALAAIPVEAQEWTRFRGPNGSGVSDATTVPTKWTDDDYHWHVALPGVGHSSPVVWEESIFITSGDEQTGRRFVVCIDTKDGSRRWTRQFDAAQHRKHKLNSFASSTPAVDRHHVYVCWATPDEFFIVALDHHGREVWRTDLGSFKGGHGFGVSPIVYEDLVVIPNEHEGDSSLIALDHRTGRVRWRVPRASKSTWATPCVFRLADGPDELIFVNYEYGITAIDPQTGATNWQINVFDKGHLESTIGSPVIAGDLVIGMSGWLAVRQEVIAVRPQRINGQVIVERVYTIDRGAPLCTTPLVVDDLLFLWADEGIVTCADAATGKLHWRKRVGGTYYSSPVCVGKHIYNTSTDGEVVVLAASRHFHDVARNQLGEPSHSTPAVAGGVMYLRTSSHLYALSGD